MNRHQITGSGADADYGIIVAGSRVQIAGDSIFTAVKHFARAGILLEGGDASVRHVRVIGNTDEGIRIASAGNTVSGNYVADSFIGIDVWPGFSGNTIRHNGVNATRGFDLVDFNGNCDNNVWTGNEAPNRVAPSCIH